MQAGEHQIYCVENSSQPIKDSLILDYFITFVMGPPDSGQGCTLVPKDQEPVSMVSASAINHKFHSSQPSLAQNFYCNSFLYPQQQIRHFFHLKNADIFLISPRKHMLWVLIRSA